jgi:hypothetical protein
MKRYLVYPGPTNDELIRTEVILKSLDRSGKVRRRIRHIREHARCRDCRTNMAQFPAGNPALCNYCADRYVAGWREPVDDIRQDKRYYPRCTKRHLR